MRISLTSSEDQQMPGDNPNELEMKTELFTCEKHGEFYTEFVFIGNRWRGEPICPACAKEAADEKERRRLLALGNAQLERKIKSSGIPKRFRGKTFDNYRVYSNNDAQKKALQVCRSYALNFKTVMEKGTCLVLCGRPGTGKNHLVAAIANTLIASGPHTVIFTRVYSAIMAIKETFRNDCATTERDVLSAFIGVDLLVLDEVGVQFNSDYERMMLFEIINSRYDEVRPTILISNLNAKEAEQFVGERVWDRLFEDGGVVLPFDWQSERRKQR